MDPTPNLDLLHRQRTFSIDETREQLQQGRPVQREAVLSGSVDSTVSYESAKKPAAASFSYASAVKTVVPEEPAAPKPPVPKPVAPAAAPVASAPKKEESAATAPKAEKETTNKPVKKSEGKEKKKVRIPSFPCASTLIVIQCAQKEPKTAPTESQEQETVAWGGKPSFANVRDEFAVSTHSTGAVVSMMKHYILRWSERSLSCCGTKYNSN